MSHPSADNYSKTTNNKTSLMNQYMKSLNAPFNSISPRFNYTKVSLEHMEKPGPGAYSFVQPKLPPHMDTSPAFRAASREKDSLFGKIVRKGETNPGPGTYNNVVSTIVKKTFNANLSKA